MNAHNCHLGTADDCSCSAVQRDLGLADGDHALIRVVDGELRVRPGVIY